MRDPAVDTVGSAVGAGGGLYTLNDGRVFIQLKPASQREPIDKVIARLRTNLARIQGITQTWRRAGNDKGWPDQLFRT